MTALERAVKALRGELQGQTSATGGYIDDGDEGLILDGVFDVSAIVRAVLMAVRDCPIEVRHLTAFEFAETKWPELIDAILNEKDTTND